ncbi:sulfatase-like hydrolase/transferase [Aquimarina sp. 2201CG5-10]|uniref:sulfatase-like hydrolase/transferase n=1 Tax=Aquimarina callyspongiae TaxID=3098150 RepID=UPI002AB3A9E4|nr:sulfatase-like hydrolase/transferase [Aquimarina sp. 2201CG5-10]MDY8136439.1 sulfatase-like hydrolase/transferase [Aquimarina sp. 2201CG5-10]
MKNIYFILFAFIISLLSCKNDDIIENEPIVTELVKPNILLIIADDMGLDATPGFSEGSVKPHMPNLQGLINSGVRFNNLWSAPTCSPTRASILTGKYGVETGVLEVGDEVSTAEISIQKYLDDHALDAYNHAVIGKWHLSNISTHPNDMGIDHYAGLLEGGVQSYWNWQLTQNGITSQSTEYITTKITDLAIDWVGEQENSWFLWLAYNAPHTPFHLPPSDLHTQGDLPSDSASIEANPLPYYMAALEAMDSEIGRFLNSMSDEEKEKTIIIFIGDNGTPNQVAQLPYRRTTAKGTLFQGGINVPMIVSGFQVSRRNEIETNMINTTDLFATIADIAGTGTSEVNNSISFKSLFTNSDTGKRTIAYSEIEGLPRNGYTIRDETYKLIVFNTGEERFYNLEEDPYEEEDLLLIGLNNDEMISKENLELKAQGIRE